MATRHLHNGVPIVERLEDRLLFSAGAAVAPIDPSSANVVMAASVVRTIRPGDAHGDCRFGVDFSGDNRWSPFTNTTGLDTELPAAETRPATSDGGRHLRLGVQPPPISGPASPWLPVHSTVSISADGRLLLGGKEADPAGGMQDRHGVPRNGFRTSNNDDDRARIRPDSWRTSGSANDVNEWSGTWPGMHPSSAEGLVGHDLRSALWGTGICEKPMTR